MISASPSKINMRKIPLPTGDIFGCYQIIDLVKPNDPCHRDVYAIKTLCCGKELQRTKETLLDARRENSETCAHCNKVAKYGHTRGFTTNLGIGEVFGWYRIKKLFSKSDKCSTLDIYQVATICCDYEVFRSRTLLLRARRSDVNLCPNCRNSPLRIEKPKKKPVKDWLSIPWGAATKIQKIAVTL